MATKTKIKFVNNAVLLWLFIYYWVSHNTQKKIATDNWLHIISIPNIYLLFVCCSTFHGTMSHQKNHIIQWLNVSQHTHTSSFPSLQLLKHFTTECIQSNQILLLLLLLLSWMNDWHRVEMDHHLFRGSEEIRVAICYLRFIYNIYTCYWFSSSSETTLHRLFRLVTSRLLLSTHTRLTLTTHYYSTNYHIILS